MQLGGAARRGHDARGEGRPAECAQVRLGPTAAEPAGGGRGGGDGSGGV